MKKIIFLLLLAIESINTQAQLQRNFWGLELGISSKYTVSNFLKNNNLTHNSQTGGNDVIIVNENLSLGGYSWGTTFGFYNNTLYTIQLILFHVEMNNYGELVDNSSNTTFAFHDLRSKLRNKYPNAENIVDPENPTFLFILRDDKTIVMLELDDQKNLILSYDDRKLRKMELNGSDL